MFSFEVKSSAGSYRVSGPVDVPHALKGGDVLVVDPAVAALLDPAIQQRHPVIESPSGEENKTLRGVEEVILQCHAAGLRRGDRLVAIGGGVTQDLVTAASSLYMRGVPWVLVPTTWLSLFDSCIGGKSAINAGSVKNLVGNFNPPVEIWIDLAFTRSLPPTAQAGGLAEAVKIAYCCGPQTFAQFLDEWAQWDASGKDEDAYRAIGTVLRAKAGVVERDEFDRGERLLLNLGHTFGHALEVATRHSVTHGQAVALGILAASQMCDGDVNEALVRSCLDLSAKFPACAPSEVDWNMFARAIESDKKHSADELRLILPFKDGPRLTGVPRNPENVSRLVDSMKRALELEQYV